MLLIFKVYRNCFKNQHFTHIKKYKQGPYQRNKKLPYVYSLNSLIKRKFYYRISRTGTQRNIQFDYTGHSEGKPYVYFMKCFSLLSLIFN